MKTAIISPRRVGFLAVLLSALVVFLGAPSGSAWAAEAIADGAEVLSLEVNKGRLVRLDRPASTVFVANPEIADIDVKSPTLVYVFGRAPGETTLFAVDSEENVVLDQSVTVTRNLSRLNSFLRDLGPGVTVDARSVAGGILLSGSVPDVATADNALRLARQFVAEDGLIINQMQVSGPNQVNLRVRVAEVSRTTLKRFGLNIDFVQTAGDFLFGIASGNLAGTGGTLFNTRNDGSFTFTNTKGPFLAIWYIES